MYGRLQGRATCAHVDMARSGVTAKRFKVDDRRPALIYISKGHYYRYKVSGRQLDIDALEAFVAERQYLDIP